MVFFVHKPSQRDQLQATYRVSQEMIEWRRRVTGAARSPQASWVSQPGRTTRTVEL
jgi:hypothetical protein